MIEPGFGRRYAPDDRDHSYRMATALPEEAPSRTYRYYRAGPVLDQGPYPHCVGYAWRQWLSTAHMMTRTGVDARSIYQAAQKVDEWPGEDYDGTSVRAGAKVLHGLGHIERYLWAWDVNTVAEWLLGNHGTVILGTRWFAGMSQPDKNGVGHITGSLQGGHAYLVVGANMKSGLFRVLNSWGRDWSQNGRMWLEGETLEQLIQWDGEACTAIEQKAG